MSKTIALVGHCGPDSSYLQMTVKSAIKNAKIVLVADDEDLSRALKDGVDLILFNRVLEYGFSDSMGVNVIKRIHAVDPSQKMMLVSNYDDAQQAAVAAGALAGFGKRELGTPRVVELLRNAIATEPSQLR